MRSIIEPSLRSPSNSALPLFALLDLFYTELLTVVLIEFNYWDLSSYQLTLINNDLNFSAKEMQVNKRDLRGYFCFLASRS